MSSRKELLKKSLGITEYPWSSGTLRSALSASQSIHILSMQAPQENDDLDEPSSSAPPDVSAFRHSDPRPASDMPGPSGLQPSQSTPGTWQQGRYDRELFWSILNSPCNPIKTGPLPLPLPPPTPSSRQVRLEASIPGRLMHAPAADQSRSTRLNNAPDVQRILAFKRLTRNINALRHRSAGTSGASRNNQQISELSGLRASRGRHHITMKRYQPTRSLLSVYRNASTNIAPSSSNANNEEPIALTTRPRHRARDSGDADRRSPASPPSPAPTPAPSLAPAPVPAPQIQVNINIHNEEEHNDEEEADNAGPQSQSILTEEVNLIHDEPSDVEILGNNTSAMSLEEEIVEIDADDAVVVPTSAPPAPSAAPLLLDDGHEHTRDTNLASTSNRAVEPTNLVSKLKRKRQDSDETLEPYTVQEFNQELLRLLECPVCLEWMEPPMSQCRRGHLVCSRCRERLHACPVCRTTFSSVRNRAMEGVAEMVRYPCRHGCGRELRLRRRGPHEASCAMRKYQCPAPACCQHACMPRQMLAEHFQSKHLPMLKLGGRHNFCVKMNAEQHDNYLVLAMDEYFHLRVDVDIRVFVYVAYIGPKCDAKNFTYEVTIEGHHSRKLVYSRSTHCDLESPAVNVSREDCFSLSLEQALNFLRFKDRRIDAEKYLDFDVEITKVESARDESDS